MSDCISPTLINWLIENLESAQDTEYVDLTEINKKYKAKASGLSLGNSLKIIFSNVKVEQDCAKHDWTKRTKRYYGITWKCQRNSHIAFGDISSVIPDDLFVLSKLTDSIIIGYVTGDIVNGSKVLQEIILNSNTSWKVLIRGKTVNPGKIGLDELYNLDSVFEIVRQMQYCRAVPEVVKSKENLAYLKDFISKVGYENSSEVCFG
jgi:CRISPR/Cas system CMR subunit Cmr4 (Cas7 group RAMP superfamily)